MRYLLWLTVAAGFSSTLAAQQASPQEIDKAVELLRQTKPQQTNAAAANSSGSATNDVDQRAREMLRRAVLGSRLSPYPTNPPASATQPTVPRSAVVQPSSPVAPRSIPPASPAEPLDSEAERKRRMAVIEQQVEAARKARHATTPSAPALNATETRPARTLSPDMEARARALLEQANQADVATTPQPAPPPTAPVPAPVAPPPAQPPMSVATQPAPPVQQRTSPPVSTPSAPPAPVAPSTTPPPSAEPPGRYQVAPATRQGTLSPDMERRARELLEQTLGASTPSQPPRPAPTPVQPSPVQPTPVRPMPEMDAPPVATVPPEAPPRTIVPPPQPAIVPVQPPVTPPAAALPARDVVAQPARSTPPVAAAPGNAMSSAEEARARELLEQTWQRLNPPRIPNTPQATAPGTAQPGSVEARAQQDIERLNNEARAKALENARQGKTREEVIRELQRDANAVARPRPDQTPVTVAPAVSPLPANAQPPATTTPTRPPQAVAPAETLAPPAPDITPSREKADAKRERPPKTKESARSRSDKKPVEKTVPLNSKQQRLAELLEAYRTDKIGPTEYHKERAKILAEP